MLTRSVQTILNSTESVEIFSIDGVEQKFDLRRLSKKYKNHHFILILANICNTKNIWEDVGVVLEVNQRENKSLHFTPISPEYLDLIEYESVLRGRVNDLIASQNHHA